MKITGIEPFVTWTQHKNAGRSWLIFKLRTNDPELYGLGEASLHEYDDQVLGLLQDWAQRYFAGQDAFDVMATEEHWRRLYQDTWARGGALGTTALSGIDIALWDLKGKVLGRPVYELLGGPVRRRIRVYANGWYTNPAPPEVIGREAKEVVARGYDAMKFDPFGREAYYTISPAELQLAEDRVAAVRESVGPNVDLLIEAHARFNPHTAIQIGQRLERYRCFWYEEPVSQENVSELAEVRRRVNIPIATGERLFTKFPFYELVKHEAVDFLQPDICNAGGISELKKIAAIAESQHRLMAPHNTNGPVGTQAALHLAAATPNFAIQEYHAEFYKPDYFALCPGQPRREGSSVPLPSGPGLGITLDEAIARTNQPQPRGWHERPI